MCDCLRDALGRDITIRCNAGRMNPSGCARRVLELGVGDRIRVAAVAGDDLMPRIDVDLSGSGGWAGPAGSTWSRRLRRRQRRSGWRPSGYAWLCRPDTGSGVVLHDAGRPISSGTSRLSAPAPLAGRHCRQSPG
nr:acyclic terpene utilization AtuA family protein [Parafrankia sp. EUN1f]